MQNSFINIFHNSCDMKCPKGLIRGNIELQTLNFWGLEIEFGAKKAQFGPFFAKICGLRPILIRELIYEPFS